MECRTKKKLLKRLKELSTVTTTNINTFYTANQEGPKHLDMLWHKARFDELTSDLEKTLDRKNALSDAGLESSIR